MAFISVHIIWGELAVSLYRRGVIDNTVRLAHAVYDFPSAREAGAFLLGVSEARRPHEWANVTHLPDQRSLGMPLRSRLIDAIFKGDVDTVEEMLDAGVNPDTKAPNGMTAVQVAAQQGQEVIAEKLLERGATVEEPETAPGAHNAVHLAAVSLKPGADRVIDLLARHQADLDREDHDGKTPLMRALEQSRLDQARKLIERGARIDVPDRHGKTAHDYFNERFGGVVGDAVIDGLQVAFKRAEALRQDRLAQLQGSIRHPVRFPTPHAHPYGRT